MLDNVSRGKSALISFYVHGAALVLQLFSHLHQIRILEKIEQGDFTEAELTFNDLLVLTSTYAYYITYIVFIILFLMWLRRAYGNVIRSGFKSDRTEGWAVGAWFVPFLNLVWPCSIMRDTYKETARLADRADQARKNDGLITFWWISWIFAGIVTRVMDRMLSGEETIAAYQEASQSVVTSAALYLIPFVLLLLIMRKTIYNEKLAAANIENSHASDLNALADQASEHPVDEESDEDDDNSEQQPLNL